MSKQMEGPLQRQINKLDEVVGSEVSRLDDRVDALGELARGNKEAGRDFEERLRALEDRTHPRDEGRRKEAFDAVARAVLDGGEGASGTKLLMSGTGAPSMLSRMLREAADLARFLETGEAP